MVFSSIIFLLYFLPIFFIVYYLIDSAYKNATILIGSIFFYAWGAPHFIFVILFTTFLDFHLVKWMDTVTSEFKKKVLLGISVSINLGLLVYFKYSNFFIKNFNSILNLCGFENITWTKLVLPIGISFYTFETITYVVDVYRKLHKPLNHFWNYQLYIILFPKLIAGPIIRYHELANQIANRRTQLDDILIGFYRFSIGLGKKVIIANQMGMFADLVFNSNISTLNSSSVWIGSIAYTFQIYFDFSGYSDMAIGLGRMMGFKFPENFHNPYTAQSITDFWRRWHITLGSWMRNYLYIPLGGNKVSNIRLYFNLWIVFLASGFWHGASWSFILWGALHGFFMVFERVCFLNILQKIGKIPSILITFFFVNLCWVFFKIENISEAFKYITCMFSFNNSSISQPVDIEFITYFCIAILFSFFTISKWGNKIQEIVYFNSYTIKKFIIMFIVSMLLFVLSVSAITSSGFNPFIYFRF